MEPNVVHHLDCFDLMARLPDASVDAIITDMPYGTTACSWDTVVDLPTWWAAVKRVLKPRGAFVTTASQPFTSALVMSNPAWFHESLVWDKVLAVGFLDANRKHMRRHEDILVFCDGMPTYNPQMTAGEAYTRPPKKQTPVYGAFLELAGVNHGTRYPKSIVELSNADRTETAHPTQKPVALYEYLIRTYTQPGDTVLDPFAGSATTFIAALNTGRNCIGGDMTREYVDLGNKRIANWRRDSDIEVAPGVTQMGLFA